MRPSLLPRAAALALLASTAALADKDVFHGFSKDGTWLAYETRTSSDSVELFFCPTSQTVNPTWPAAVNDMDRTDERGLTCARYVDLNRAPLDWKKLLVLPEVSNQLGAVRVLPEVVGDGENPGFVLEAAGKKQVCYASGLREDSRLTQSWWHPSGKWVAALIDGAVHLCPVQLKGAVVKGGKKK